MLDTPQKNTNDLRPYWMPFTANRQFKSSPRMLVSAKGMYYKTKDGRELIDGSSGMWCVNAGHGSEPIIAAIREQAGRMDYATAFQMGHPQAFELANRLTAILPKDLEHVFLQIRARKLLIPH